MEKKDKQDSLAKNYNQRNIFNALTTDAEDEEMNSTGHDSQHNSVLVQDSDEEISFLLPPNVDSIDWDELEAEAEQNEAELMEIEEDFSKKDTTELESLEVGEDEEVMVSDDDSIDLESVSEDNSYKMDEKLLEGCESPIDKSLTENKETDVEILEAGEHIEISDDDSIDNGRRSDKIDKKLLNDLKSPVCETAMEKGDIEILVSGEEIEISDDDSVGFESENVKNYDKLDDKLPAACGSKMNEPAILESGKRVEINKGASIRHEFECAQNTGGLNNELEEISESPPVCELVNEKVEIDASNFKEQANMVSATVLPRSEHAQNNITADELRDTVAAKVNELIEVVHEEGKNNVQIEKENISSGDQQILPKPLKKPQKARKSFPHSGLKTTLENIQREKFKYQTFTALKDIDLVQGGNEIQKSYHSKLHLKELENIVDLSLDIEHFKTIGLKGFNSGQMQEKVVQNPPPSSSFGAHIKKKKVRFGTYSLESRLRRKRLQKKLRRSAQQMEASGGNITSINNLAEADIDTSEALEEKHEVDTESSINECEAIVEEVLGEIVMKVSENASYNDHMVCSDVSASQNLSEASSELASEILIRKSLRKRKHMDGEDSPASSVSDNESRKLRLEDLGLVPRNGLGKDVTEKLQAFVAASQSAVPLCHCRVNVGSLARTKVTYCQALDTIDDKIIGCCKKVKNHLLVRPSPKISFFAVCEVHRTKLKYHQCCPGCGRFCTQGVFFQCQAGRSLHVFHKECATISDGLSLCPHCGSTVEIVELTLKIRAVNMPTFFLEQRPRSGPYAKFTFPSKDTKNNASVSSFTFPETGQKFSAASILPSPEREELKEVLDAILADKDWRPPNIKSLFGSSKAGDFEKILFHLGMGHDPNVRSNEDSNASALHAAASKGHIIIVHLLIQSGATADLMDDNMKTPLMEAAENDKIKVVKYLVNAGATIDLKGEDGMTCLHLAARAGHLSVVMYICENTKVNVNVQDEGGWTPLIWATEYKHTEVVDYLLCRGADPNLIDVEENTALHWAAFSGSTEICGMFIDHGCKVSVKNEHGDTPLHIATRQDHFEVVTQLLSRGADVFAENNQKEQPLACCLDPTSKVWMVIKMNIEIKTLSQKRTGPTERMLHRDISMSRENIPIVCINWVDDDNFPQDYQYVVDNVETSEFVSINRLVTSLQHCICTDNCGSPSCACTINSVRLWYDRHGKLVDDFSMQDPPILFECNKACRCWRKCANRVVQDGIKVRLQLFRTAGKGWGVRALHDIPKGTFICEYIGEVITDSEADMREDDSYLFDLDNKDGESYCIDARYYGNVARFINHLCEPNVTPIKAFVEHQDLRFPRIALFSNRDIKAYEELGFDYGEKFWIIKYKHFTCSCGAEKCKYSKDTIQTTLNNYYTALADQGIDVSDKIHSDHKSLPPEVVFSENVSNGPVNCKGELYGESLSTAAKVEQLNGMEEPVFLEQESNKSAVDQASADADLPQGMQL